MKKKGFTTTLLHTSQSKKDPHGALQAPIYGNSAFEFESSEDIEGAFKGTKPAHAYSRSGNPTVEFFEMRIKAITNSRAVLACASGMSAITNIILGLCNTGDNIITTKYLFGNTISLLEDTMKPLGIETRYADLKDLKSIASLIDSKTRLIFFETISNPQLEVIDSKALSEITKKHKIILVADTSITPPNAFDAKEFGIDVSVMSSTKFISCGASTLGGVIVDTGLNDWEANPKLRSFAEKFGDLAFISKLRKEVYRNTGGCLSPFNAYLQSIGLETIKLRYDKASQNASELANWLEKQSQIKRVHYPGLKSSPYFTIAQKQFGKYPSALLTFDLGSQELCYKFMDKLQIIKRATNLSDNKSLIIHPASTIYSEFGKKSIESFGVRDTMMRLSVGIEDVEDLIDDMDSALH